MSCTCKQEHVFLGLDFGTTRSGAFATHAWVCQEHKLFQVIEEAQVKKFLTRFILSAENKIELVGTADDVPDESAVKNAKLEILLSDPGWFERTEDFDEIQSWVEQGWQGAGRAGLPAEHFGIAIKKLYELALEAFGKPNIRKESITTVVTFPNLRDNAKETLKIGLMYSNISSRCQDVHVGMESVAALKGLLYTYPKVSREALAGRESIIVADCGGMTLDMAAFREFNPRCEGAPAAGFVSVLGGGLWIDRNFEKLVDGKLRELMARISKPNHQQVKWAKSNLMSQWHSFIKGQPLIPMGTAYSFMLHGMEGGINRTDLERVLIPECQKIADAIERLGKKEREENGGRQVKRVFLTGGLGCSKAVRELVQRILDTKVEGNEPALQIQDTRETHALWNAVALGAAHYFDPTIPVDSSSWKPFPGTPNWGQRMG